jgi:hypothetical protein
MPWLAPIWTALPSGSSLPPSLQPGKTLHLGRWHALDRLNVRREFRKITRAAGLGTDWVPREMRHTFVSLLSSKGTAFEDIADLVGHRGTATTETVYRKVIVPELRRGGPPCGRPVDPTRRFCCDGSRDRGPGRERLTSEDFI